MSTSIKDCILKYGTPHDRKAVGDYGCFPPPNRDPNTIRNTLESAFKAQDTEAVSTLADYMVIGPFAGADSDRLASIRELLPKAGGQMKIDLENAKKIIEERFDRNEEWKRWIDRKCYD